ncbi:uncharacterized protein PHALS_00829 [Plasmopara halstedii]|uniref:Uncharacterized protein n=1 Tax=Plasmopara halstedii TaxID=4781 RepID=A0A0P1AU13_PLAHL|nr:uncharacterized protein PHALS_00829 [Plasmopara halstedii]CEG44465.1 hypothetical protein PHALS_00829 [Plasmopara halstedii]|eukprot:XP_024580834.1 hypothetical protein PHALS_00829 [Plasmopara halstedii]
MVVQQRGGSNNSSDNGGTDSENVPVRRQEGLGGGSVTPIIDGSQARQKSASLARESKKGFSKRRIPSYA